MLVKLLSMQRVINYGSFYQAYALKRVIESFGHSVEFCDTLPGEQRHRGEKTRPIPLADKLAVLVQGWRGLLGFARNRAFRRRRLAVFEKEAWPLLGLGPEPNLDYSGDAMAIGSDEVFNYTKHKTGYVPAFFGHGIAARTVFAYGASAGYADCADIAADGMAEEIASGLARFAAIGVRDANTEAIVRRYGRCEPRLVLDPTLIYDFDAELAGQAPPAIDGPFLVVYAYYGRLHPAREVAAIRRYARERGLKTVAVGFYHGWCDRSLAVSPFALLALFAAAECVVTDTFHGTIFSVKSRKPFVSLIRVTHARGSNANKVGFLLEQLGLQARIVTDIAELAARLEAPIDYDRVYARLARERERSLAFLADALKLAQERAGRAGDQAA